MCLVAITCALRWGVTHVGEFNYSDIAHPLEGKLFQILKAHQGMGLIQGLRDEEMAIYVALLCIFVKNMGKRPSFG